MDLLISVRGATLSLGSRAPGGGEGVVLGELLAKVVLMGVPPGRPWEAGASWCAEMR